MGTSHFRIKTGTEWKVCLNTFMQVLLNSRGVEQSMSSVRFEDRIPNIMRKPKPWGTMKLSSRCSKAQSLLCFAYSRFQTTTNGGGCILLYVQIWWLKKILGQMVCVKGKLGNK